MPRLTISTNAAFRRARKAQCSTATVLIARPIGVAPCPPARLAVVDGREAVAIEAIKCCAGERRGAPLAWGMVDLRERRVRYAARLEDGLRRVVGQLSAMPEVQRISVFGSYARGRRDLATDLDLLVILDTAEPLPERLARLYSLLNSGVDLDIVAWTPAEHERMLSRPFGRTIAAEEQVLYEAGSDR